MHLNRKEKGISSAITTVRFIQQRIYRINMLATANYPGPRRARFLSFMAGLDIKLQLPGKIILSFITYCKTLS